MASEPGEREDGLSSGVMRDQALCQLPAPEIAIIRIFNGIHGNAFPRLGGITLD